MKLSDKQIKRLGIFFFYDEQGIVDDYVINMLSEMNRHFSELLIVCNGKLTGEGRTRFEALEKCCVIVRDNVGFDVWAYKTALEYYGFDKLARLDELILFNYTIMGPVSQKSLDTMFTKMNACDIDFWGITIHHGAPFDVWGILEEHILPVHIQSHFIAVRKPMLRSYEFQKYWKHRPRIRTYEEAVAYHEAIFTKRFADMGYRWEVLCDTTERMNETLYPMFNIPVELIRDYGCPFFKRKIFYYEVKEKLQENRNQIAAALYKYLKQKTNYDVKMILQNLLRSVPQTDLLQGLNFNYIIDRSQKDVQHQVAVLIDTRYKGLHGLPVKELKQTADIYFVRDDSEDVFDGRDADKDNVFYITKKKNNFASIYYALPKLKRSYKYYCFLANDEQTYIDIRNDNQSYKEIIEESIWGDSQYRNGVLELFEDEESLGLAYPPNPIHGDFFEMLNELPTETEECITQFFVGEKEVAAKNLVQGSIWQFTGCFWCRGEVIQKFIANYQEAAWERVEHNHNIIFSAVLSIWVQLHSYYTARIYSKSLAVNFLTNEEQMLKDINCASHNKTFNFSKFYETVAIKDQHAKSYVYYDYGEGYLSIYRHKVGLDYDALSQGIYTISIPVPVNVKRVRLQLAEGLYCVAKRASVSDSTLELMVQGGLQEGDYDIFNNPYPQYQILGDFTECHEFHITFEAISFFYSLENLDIFLDILKDKNRDINDYRNDCYNKNMMLEQLKARLVQLQSERDSLEQFRLEIMNSKVFRLLHVFDRKR